MRVLVTGTGGMIGRAMVKHCAQSGDEVFACDRRSLDITNETAIREIFAHVRPETVINCAAWTDVDGCELDHKRAYKVNAEAVGALAAGCRQIGASFLTISTDYVFDGAKKGYYTQRDDPNPTSVYGTAKLAGERLAQTLCARAIVVRTGWVFGASGSNFLSKVIERGQAGETIKAIDDAYGTPTYAPDLVRRLRELVALDLPGVYHVANAGEGASYAEFSRRALAAAGCENAKIEMVSIHSLHRPAARPINSRLRCLLSEAIRLPPLPDWQIALADFAAESAAPRS